MGLFRPGAFQSQALSFGTRPCPSLSVLTSGMLTAGGGGSPRGTGRVLSHSEAASAQGLLREYSRDDLPSTTTSQPAQERSCRPVVPSACGVPVLPRGQHPPIPWDS